MEPPGGIRPPSRPYEGRVLSLNYGGENGQTDGASAEHPEGCGRTSAVQFLDVHDAKHLRRDGVLGSAPSCRTGGGEALRRLKLDTSTPVRVSPRTPRANSVAAIADRWPRRTDGCANVSWCDLLTEDTRLCQRVFVEVSRLSAKRSILAKLDNFDFIYFKIRCFIRLLRHTPCRQRGTVRGRELGMGVNGSWTSGFGECRSGRSPAEFQDTRLFVDLDKPRLYESLSFQFEQFRQLPRILAIDAKGAAGAKAGDHFFFGQIARCHRSNSRAPPKVW